MARACRPGGCLVIVTEPRPRGITHQSQRRCTRSLPPAQALGVAVRPAAAAMSLATSRWMPTATLFSLLAVGSTGSTSMRKVSIGGPSSRDSGERFSGRSRAGRGSPASRGACASSESLSERTSRESSGEFVSLASRCERASPASRCDVLRWPHGVRALHGARESRGLWRARGVRLLDSTTFPSQYCEPPPSAAAETASSPARARQAPPQSR